MRSGACRYPVDRYLVESSNKFEMVNIIDDELWKSEPALRPEDEIILRKLHDMLQTTTDDLKLLSGELSKFHEPGFQLKTAPTLLDEEFNEKVHIEEVVNAKFHGYKMIENPPKHNLQTDKPRNDTTDGKLLKSRNPKIVNTGIQVNAPANKRSVRNKNLVISRTKCMQIIDENQDINSNSKKLNNGKVINHAPAVAYNEFCFKYIEPKSQVISPKKLTIQDMPSINIRNELTQQNVLQLNIIPEINDVKEIAAGRSNVSVVEVRHETLPKLVVPVQAHQQYPPTSSYKQTTRKVSKLPTCHSSGSISNVSSDVLAIQKSHRSLNTAMRSSPNTSRDRNKKITLNKKDVNKRTHLNVDEWKKKLNMVYGSSTSRKSKISNCKTTHNKILSKSKQSSVSKAPSVLNNTEYIPYSQLTLGGVKVSDIEKEISDLENKQDMPLSPILDKILSSRESSFHTESPRMKHLRDSPKILTTSDENLLQEVIDIEKSVSETLSKNLNKTCNNSVSKSLNALSDVGADVNESYADDFEDNKSDQSVKSDGDNEFSGDETEAKSKLEEVSNGDPHHNGNDKHNGSNESYNQPGPSKDIKNSTYTKASNLSFKNSVDIFEYIHSVDTQDIAIQSNTSNKITPQETQTSPRNIRPIIQPIHNDLWPTLDPRHEVEKMFELEKDFIKKLIIDEYGDLIEKNISKPPASNENKREVNRNNVAASQKNTQTSPAHTRSVMTSPRRTKTRTTSPFLLTVSVNQQTSPIVRHEEESINIPIEPADISVNLSSPRFSLRLPQNSHEVLSNLGNCGRSPSKVTLKKNKPNDKTFTKITVTSSSSIDADTASSDLSSLGEVRIKRLRKRLPSISDVSSTSNNSLDCNQGVHSADILPLRSEGELSLGQVPKKKLQKPTKSDGETSFGPYK